MAGAPLDIITPFKRYSPVGRCIYCRHWHDKLEKEHIIPFGLADDSLVLPKASCRKCAEKTRNFETACLRHMWWPFRTHIGAPSKKMEQPKEFELKRINVTSYNEKTKSMTYERDTVTQVPADQYPLFYYAFTFRQAGLLSGIHSISTNHGDFCLLDHDATQKLSLKDKQGFRLGPGNWEQFCRLLAKICYSYATAELGYKSFSPYVNSYIRGAPLNTFDYIGCSTAIAPKSDALHEIGIRAIRGAVVDFVVVSLRLFAFLGTPTYEVVVGQLDEAFDKRALLTQSLYAIDVRPPLPATNLRPVTVGVRGPGGF